MALTIKTYRRIQPYSSGQSRPSTSRERDSRTVAALKASLVGGSSLIMVLLLGLIPLPAGLPPFALAGLVIPSYVVLCLGIGFLAGIYGDEGIQTSRQGGEAGWMAGFWAGIIAGMAAMVMAATGILMGDFGQSLLGRFTPAELTLLSVFARPDTMALAGRVFGAFVVYGVVGSLVTALFSAVGGMAYCSLSR